MDGNKENYDTLRRSIKLYDEKKSDFKKIEDFYCPFTNSSEFRKLLKELLILADYKKEISKYRKKREVLDLKKVSLRTNIPQRKLKKFFAVRTSFLQFRTYKEQILTLAELKKILGLCYVSYEITFRVTRIDSARREADEWKAKYYRDNDIDLKEWI